MIIDHICFAVKDLSKAVDFWDSAFGYKQMTQIITNTRQQVKVVFITKDDSVMVKLIEPLEGNASIERFVKGGGGFHHICFKCDKLGDGIKDLNGKGLITLVAPEPGEAFENEDIAFLMTRYGFGLELIETNKKAGALSENQ